MLKFIPSKAAVYAAIGAFFTALIAWLRMDAKRDQRRQTEAEQAQSRLDAIQSKQEIKRDVETQDDNALVDRLSR